MNVISTNRACGERPAPLWGGTLAGLALLAFVSVSSAQVSVETIGGGVRTECGNSYGFAGKAVGVVTWTQSQFHLPSATALDSQGNLWVADTDNSDIEWITMAGNRTTSLTYEYNSAGNYHKFPDVIGVAVDANNNLYVLTTTTLSKFENATASIPSLNPQFEIPLSMFSSSPATAIAVANDATTTIYLAFAGSATGSIVRIPQPYPASPTYSAVVASYPFKPAGMSMRIDGQLAVSDTLHNGIYVVPTAAGSTPVLVAGGPSTAIFNQPRGIAASGDGRMVVCDSKNNRVAVIDTSYNTTTLYGSPSNVWTATCCSCNPALYGGWVDGTSGKTGSSASSRDPLSVTISPDGTLFVTEGYYNLIRAVAGSGLSPVVTINSGLPGTSTNFSTIETLEATSITASSATLNAEVNPGGSQTSVYFEWGPTTNYGSNTAPVIISTDLDTTNAVAIPLTGLQVNTVLHFQAVAINSGGTANGGDRTLITTTASSSSASNQVGFSSSHLAGIGSTVYIPLALTLQSGTEVTSLQFRVEVTPTTNGGAGLPPPISTLSLAPITSNDFVQLTGPAPGNAPVNFTITPYTNTVSPNGQGLLVFAGPGSGLDIQGFGVVGLLSFQIPYNATTNQTYGLTVLYPSGSATNIVPLNQTVTVADVPYLVGDSSPATGYDAGEFGSGVLDNNDVINAIYASANVRVPPFNSDVFNAMDAFPPPIGDGLIQYQDWNTILLESVGLQTPNWERFWTNSGNLVGLPLTNGAGLAGDTFAAVAKDAVGSSPPGLVWLRQASISAGSVSNVVPGQTCSMPVYASVRPGCSLSGVQFRAIVSPNGNAPAVGQVQFNPADGIPSPMFSGPGLSANDIVNAWELGAFTPPLQNTNLIGTISFQIPTNAQAGQSYAVHFTGVDGAPDSTTTYGLESFPGYAWVLSAARQPASITSDEWKLHFFGSLTSSLAADNVDADGDGALNWQEYLAGTDPTNPASALRFNGAGVSPSAVNGIALSWLTAPDKTYILQSIPALGGKSWTAINTNAGDGYTYQFIQNNYKGTAEFFRILLKP